ncbi:MAG: hypothetical protein NDJ94_18430 [Vicinamibacteria bacterium]|nr:hypothetical protein [Vicinamibacteria bacterium]
MDALSEPLALSALRFLAFALVAVFGPGAGLQRGLGQPVRVALVIPLGTAAAALWAWLEVAWGLPGLFPVGVVLCSLPLLFRGLGRVEGEDSWRGPAPALLALVALLAVSQYDWNRLTADGRFQLDPLVPFDAAFHAGLTLELAAGYPPQVPGVSGLPLGYHLGPDLVRYAAWRWAGVHPFDSQTRFDVTLWGVALILALRAAMRALGGGPRAVALAGFVPLLGDISWVFAGDPQAHWWTDLLRGNLLVSVAHANPLVPALGLALGTLSLVAVAAPGAATLALAAACALATPFFKVFLGAQLAAGLAFAALFARGPARRALLVPAFAAAIGTLGLATGTGGETVAVVLAPLDLVHVTRSQLGMAPASGLGLAAFALAWIVLSLGLRVFGLGPAWAALCRGEATARALAPMALGGWPLGLLIRVAAPEVLGGQSVINDAAYFVEQSGPLLWLFALLGLERALGERLSRPIVLATLAALTMPATLQFVVKKRTADVEALPAAMVELTRALERASAPGDVVLQRPAGRYPPAPVILIGRRVTYERFTPYLTQFAPRPVLEARHAEVHRFFRTRDPAEAERITRALGARFVALHGSDRLRFEPPPGWRVLHDAPGARLYRID